MFFFKGKQVLVQILVEILFFYGFILPLRSRIVAKSRIRYKKERSKDLKYVRSRH